VLVAGCLAIAALTGCGGGNSGASGTSSAQVPAKLASTETVAQIGSHAITHTLLGQWMTADIGSDYYEIAKQRVPAGLVSEPADDGACVAALKRLASGGTTASATGGAKLTGTCAELYRAIRAQTLTFLVGAYWLADFDAAHGIAVSEAQVQHSIEQVKAKEYPAPGQFQRSLDARDRTLSQELFLARVDLLEAGLQRALASKAKPYTELSKQVGEASSSATCRAEYVVVHCREFTGHGYSGPAPASLLRTVASLARKG
jgi:hypothetical protein